MKVIDKLIVFAASFAGRLVADEVIKNIPKPTGYYIVTNYKNILVRYPKAYKKVVEILEMFEIKIISVFKIYEK